MRAGLAAEFGSGDDLLIALAELRRLGYRELDAFTPHPMAELEEVLALGRSRLNWVVFPLGMGGAIFAFWLQWYCNAWSYALNVGGRPPFGWITDIPITFESGILATSLCVFVGLFWTIGLPNLTHPLFKVDGFERASLDRFWLAIGAGDVALDRARTTEELARLHALTVAPFGGWGDRTEARR
jgi:hypothetical protein